LGFIAGEEDAAASETCLPWLRDKRQTVARKKRLDFPVRIGRFSERQFVLPRKLRRLVFIVEDCRKLSRGTKIANLGNLVLVPELTQER